MKEFDAEEIKVIAGSVDPVDKTKELVEKLGITYSMACGMDAISTSQLTGGFYEKDKKFLQPTNLMVRPDKTIEMASYSTGPLGRFVASDVLKAIRFYKSQK